MRMREGCRGTETFTSIKSQEIDKNIGRKVLECDINRSAENVFVTKLN